MKRLLLSVFDNIIAPLVVILLTPAALGGMSYIKTGDWKTWFTKAPWWIWPALVFGGLIWLSVALIRKRKRDMEENSPSVFAVSVPKHGEQEIAELSHADVKWKIMMALPGLGQSVDPDNIPPDRISVATPPRCPDCGAKLEEEETFWAKFKWACVRCGFSIKNDQSYYSEKERAQLLAESHFEEEYDGPVRRGGWLS
ncbi:DNA-directed RNA polymerase subunit RPC12/RpoP [Salinibacter ruber]|uniref:hypothetical protein n=1 Tax=Salinibacter ruber TaxID=146919 RepID=UPI002169D0D3|nr:hypothetical protein [Salinibacter ruber]MCS3751298.1 DNA-directed RNA polymerase subunit RPC12/RpoP [Salinibacter ruber]